MGRKKQSRPRRSGGLLLEGHGQDQAAAELGDQAAATTEQSGTDKLDNLDEPLFVEVERSLISDEHLDISELGLTDLHVMEGFSGFRTREDLQGSDLSLRFKVANVNNFVDRIKLGHWPVLSASDISLELLDDKASSLKVGRQTVMLLFGKIDGTDEGVSGLVHLAALRFLSLRPIEDDLKSGELSTLRVRVEILNSAFGACQSLLENTRQLWKKSMMNVMAWLRPEVMTSEARYGICQPSDIGDNSRFPQKHHRFDVAGFYEAIKPSKEEPMLPDTLPDLLLELRPYQRRAANWMVQREKLFENGRRTSPLLSPLCVPVDFIDTSSKMFYNPFSGNISMQPEYFSPDVSGGILADEMGLGKTVELLACILAHRGSASEASIEAHSEIPIIGDHANHITIRRLKRERVECICGAVSESYRYTGLWVQCDICDAWQHSDCVDYSARGKKVKDPPKMKQKPQKKNAPIIVEREGKYVCKLCSELMEAAASPLYSGATLIVSPAPILHQWHAEIIRHMKPGSMKVLVYQGVRNATLSNERVPEVSELVNYDIILTTYDVLKEDLSHDSDRQEGDRHFMRFQKRYPVIPTPLTRILWWRVCLDEAQMVESNAAAATEMALRLPAIHRWCITGTPIQRRLDDLHGLLKFLALCPFDVSRWWIEVIREPYERRDAGATEFTHKLFKQIMWRSSKVHVADELHLPSQVEQLSFLSFSPIEEHFYQRQHETCADHARELIKNLKDDISKRQFPESGTFITQFEAAKLLNSLLKLRQACCHPQVGSSGLRSLQHTPMTMEEVMRVLIGKTKIEGEEALRKVIVALNGLAAIAIIQNNPSEAVSLYGESLDLAAEHSEDFDLDPLLNIHIRHNLAEMLLMTSNEGRALSPDEAQHSGNSETKVSKKHSLEECNMQYAIKRPKLSEDARSSTFNTTESPITCSVNKSRKHEDEHQMTSKSFDYDSLLAACGKFKQKYLVAFMSRLIMARQDFQRSYEQVRDASTDLQSHHSVWWLEALHHAEQNKNLSDEFIRKVAEAVLETGKSSRPPKIGSNFRSITGLKYYIQTGLDTLEASRKTVVDRLLDIDQTVEEPGEVDIARVGSCRNCQPNGDGASCILCEMDELFQIYAARLFRLTNASGAKSLSAEEALELMKKQSERNQFYRTLSENKSSSESSKRDEELTGKRDAVDKVMVSKSPSELEILLGAIRSCCKVGLGKEGKSAATNQIRLLEGMRKEFGVARSLCIAQAQLLRAHDELRMATSRLRLREDDNDKSPFAMSCLADVEANSVQFSSEKFMSLRELSCTKGKLCYLKGLVKAKQRSAEEAANGCPSDQAYRVCKNDEQSISPNEETCPVCQEKIGIQKMVFHCGHVTCCKCLVAMTEHRQSRVGDLHLQKKWVMCPTCRQPTNIDNIACVNEKLDDTGRIHTTNDGEHSIVVQGSYGTKIEAVTRRILWIKRTDPKAKVLVFSSWNDVLDVLGHSFAANNVSYIRMKGGRKAHTTISLFKGQIPDTETKRNGKVPTHDEAEEEQSDPKFIQVLMLLIQHGANGLNLLEAQHVIMVEPLLNPAVEAQAISRVHRMGQKNTTVIHRFIVKKTVEESIYKLSRSRNMTRSTVISGNTKNQDQPLLTLKDVESLFGVVAPPSESDCGEKSKPKAAAGDSESLMHLLPSRAATIAAERRLQGQEGPQTS